MFNRKKFYHQYQIKFANELRKVFGEFSPGEQIQICDTLIGVSECYLKDTPDYNGAQKAMEALRSRFGSKLLNFHNVQIVEYLKEQSLKHIDLQYELKVENAGDEDNFFTADEQRDFLRGVIRLLNLHKEMSALQIEPAVSKEELAGTEKVKIKGKIKRERDDNVTRLNQEQTALLIYCLRKTKVILKDEYLNNKEAGQAFSMLTGYSADTLRQNLNKSELARIASMKNIEAVAKVMKELQRFVEDEIKPEE